MQSQTFLCHVLAAAAAFAAFPVAGAFPACHCRPLSAQVPAPHSCYCLTISWNHRRRSWCSVGNLAWVWLCPDVVFFRIPEAACWVWCLLWRLTSFSKLRVDRSDMFISITLVGSSSALTGAKQVLRLLVICVRSSESTVAISSSSGSRRSCL